jgi:phage protein D
VYGTTSGQQMNAHEQSQTDQEIRRAGERSKAQQAHMHASLLLLHSAAVRPREDRSERAGRRVITRCFPALHAAPGGDDC